MTSGLARSITRNVKTRKQIVKVSQLHKSRDTK
jgi:hypothetical protein